MKDCKVNPLKAVSIGLVGGTLDTNQKGISEEVIVLSSAFGCLQHPFKLEAESISYIRFIFVIG